MLCACLLLSSTYAYSSIDTFTHSVSLTDRLIAACIIALVFGTFLAVASSKRQLRFAGLASLLGGTTYPLYLLHNRIGKEIFDATDGLAGPLLRLAAIALLVFFASAAIHLVVERRVADSLKARLLSIASHLSEGKTRRSVNTNSSPG
jgi:peptidoglycan/LPS O-acetylase OafA/YrhL